MSNPTDPRLQIIKSLGNARAELDYLLSEAESEQVFLHDESKKMVKLLSDLYEMQQDLLSRSRREEAAKKPIKLTLQP